jgi:hypothetical protein
VNESAKSAINVNTNLNISTSTIRIGATKMEKVRTAYYGVVNFSINRPVILEKTGESYSATIWQSYATTTGPLTEDYPSRDVRKWLDKLLTQFAAAWYVDNP